MLPIRSACLAAFLVVLGANWLPAQFARPFADEPDYQRLGLEQVWSTRVQLDSSRARVRSVHLQIVGTSSYAQLQQSQYQVCEVTYPDGAVRYSERDVDSGGQVLGRGEARRLAEKRVILLGARGIKAEINTREIPLAVVYAQSTTGTLHAIDAETGQTLWAVTVGDPRFPSIGPATNDSYVAVANGSTLYLLNRVTGEPVWDRPLHVNPAISLGMSDQYVFVPGISGRVEGYQMPTDEDDHAFSTPWRVQSTARITAGPSTTTSTVSWGTVRGQVLVASLQPAQMAYRHQTSGQVNGEIAFLPPNRLVIASNVGYVTALNEEDGEIQWEFSTGFDVSQPPAAYPDFTYAVTNNGQLFCLSSQDGSEQWVARGIDQVIGCGKDRLYAKGSDGTLHALDKRTGARLASIATPIANRAYNNSLTDRLYLFTQDGTLLCLRELDAHYPTVYRPLAQPSEQRQPGQPASQRATATEPATEPSASPPTISPFGDDPFGGDAGMDDQPNEPQVDDSQPPAEGDEPAADPGEAPSPDDNFDDPFDFG